MNLPPDFEARLQQSTDAELIEMLDHVGDYLPEAIEAANRELERRGLAPKPPAQPAASVDAEAAPNEEGLADPSLSLAIVATFRNVVEAGMLKARLEAAGIEACIPEEYTPQVFWSLIPSPLESVTVQVAAKDYEAAKAILSDFVSAAFPLDHPAGAVPQQNADLPRPAPKHPDAKTATEGGKPCVSCNASIPLAAQICPACGWTQPDTK